ncbi:MAG: CPBP family intramembrane metalloprotease [Bacteroidia bacterium]|nr:CPBP family intramembrane metalloprotease [Bacteroidia bacterium]
MDKQTQEVFYYPNLGQSLGLVIRLLLIGIPFFFIRKILETDNPLWNSLTLMLTYVCGTAIIVLFGIRRMRKLNKDGYSLKFKRVNIWSLLIMTLMMVSVFIIASAIAELIPMTPETEQYYKTMFQPNIFFFILGVFVAPVIEEILYRGIILEGMLNNYTPAKSIIWSAVFFGAAHLNPWQGISALLTGLLIGWVYWKTNSLIPCIILHCSNNLIGVIMMSAPAFKLFDYKILLLTLLCSASIVLIVGYMLLNKKLASNSP